LQENSDHKTSSQDETGDFRTSLGEVVRRVDLDQAAGSPSRFARDAPGGASYEGVELAKAALAGDQAALDKFHELAGLALPRVIEYSEGVAVRLATESVGKVFGGVSCEVPPHQDEKRPVFVAWNECGHRNTRVDAAELVAWILSSEGRAALARRGVYVDVLTTSNDRMSVATSTLASIANVLGIEGGPTPWIENTRAAILTEIRRRAAEAELDLQEGDVVTLTVGGNQMTVTQVHSEGQHFGQIAVAWFDGTTLHRDAFEKAALVRAAP